MSSKKRQERAYRPPFVMMVHRFMDEPAFRALPCGAQMLYVHIKRFYNGQNNGELYLSVRKAAALLNISKNTATKHFRTLEEHGFIRPHRVGTLGVEGQGKATIWRLTEEGCLGHKATKDYKLWFPEN